MSCSHFRLKHAMMLSIDAHSQVPPSFGWFLSIDLRCGSFTCLIRQSCTVLIIARFAMFCLQSNSLLMWYFAHTVVNSNDARLFINVQRGEIPMRLQYHQHGGDASLSICTSARWRLICWVDLLVAKTRCIQPQLIVCRLPVPEWLHPIASRYLFICRAVIYRFVIS